MHGRTSIVWLCFLNFLFCGLHLTTGFSIASFNIRIFGIKKISDQKVVDTLVKVINEVLHFCLFI